MLKASRITGVNKDTPHRIYGLLRKRVVELAHAEAAPFAGCVEVDESYFGPRRVRGIRGRGAARNVPVIGLLKGEEELSVAQLLEKQTSSDD